MKRVVALIFILSVAAFAAEKQKLTAIDFSPGMVTAKGNLTKGFTEAEIAWNVDFTRERFQVGPRRGFSKQTTLPLVDSLLWNGIATVNYRSGDKEFLAIAKWTDSNWAGIFGSDLNGFGFGTLDSITHVADTGTAVDSMTTLGDTTYRLTITVWQGGSRWENVVQGFDTSTRAFFVDTFVTVINASGAGAFVTALDLGDTLAIQQDDADNAVTLTYGCNPFVGTGHCASWILDTAQAIDSSDIILSRFPATGSPRFAQHRDNVYIVNGVGRGAVYNGKSISDFPMRAPGEPSILPLLVDGTMHGQYRYIFRHLDSAFTSDSVRVNRRSGLSQPVRVDSSVGGQVVIYNWPIPNADAWHSTDSVPVEISRTVGTFGTLDKSDSIWVVDTVIIANADSAASVTFTDTTSDVTLRLVAGMAILPNWLFFHPGGNWSPDSVMTGLVAIDTSASRISVSPGMPTFTAAQSCSDADSGMWRGGAVVWESVLGWAWIVVPIDTITNIPGDSSRSMWLYQPTKPDAYTSGWNTDGDSLGLGFARSDHECVEMVIPRVVGAPNTVFDLYRAPVVPLRVDSARLLVFEGGSNPPWTWHTRTAFRPYAPDYEVLFYYFIGQFNPGDTLTDSLQFDSLLLRDIYRHNVAPSNISDVATAGNRLIAMDEGNVYITELIDTITRFNVLEQKPVNPDGGDQNTGLWASSQGIVKVAKNRSLYNLFRSGGIWQIPELSAHYGMVAPLSHASAPEGDYFLSLDGVRLEREGHSKAQSFIPFEVSTVLDNLDGIETSILKNAVGIYHDDKYIASFPDLDTALVLNVLRVGPQEIKFAWSQWGVVPVGHTFYRVSVNNIIIPGDSLYFIQSGDPAIYVFGSSEKDDGQDVFWQYRSGPTNPVDGNLHYIEDVAMFVNSDETGSGSYAVSFYNEKGVIPTGMSFALNRLDTANYHRFDGVDTLGGEGALFWQFDIQRNVALYDSGTTSIEGIWITTSTKEKYGSQ